jgi:glycosyltransferase involved in cell wall biosynthesis
MERPHRTTPVRVCMVVNNLDVGGLEKVVLSLLRHLPREAVEPHLICLSGPGRLYGEVDLPPAHRLVLDKAPELNAFPERLQAPALMVQIGKFMLSRGIEVAHVHNLAPLIFAGLPARLLGRSRPRVVYTEHNQIYRAREWAKRRFRHYVRLADEVVAVSNDLRNTLVSKLQIVGTPVRVLHNGIDPAPFANADGSVVRRELGIPDDQFLVGTAVVLSEQKGIRHLLDAARIVRAADPSLSFVVGGDGPLRVQLEKAAAELQLGDTVRFLGYRRDVPQLIAALDAYVLPSLWEGLPLALLEALALGKPIVATRVGGNPEVVEDGENGLLVPPRDPEALARALLTVRRDAALRARMRKNNLEKFSREFSLRSMVDAHVELYRELAANRRAPMH